MHDQHQIEIISKFKFGPDDEVFEHTGAAAFWNRITNSWYVAYKASFGVEACAAQLHENDTRIVLETKLVDAVINNEVDTKKYKIVARRPIKNRHYCEVFLLELNKPEEAMNPDKCIFVSSFRGRKGFSSMTKALQFYISDNDLTR
jgi:hypothetical protein